MPCVASAQSEVPKAPLTCDISTLQKCFEGKFGRAPNKNEQLSLDALTNDRDRRRMLQVIEFEEGEDLDITKISLPKLPEDAETEQVVDEELDPTAWRQIAKLCSNTKVPDAPQAEGSAAPAIAPKAAEVQGADFVSVKDKRATVKGEQEKQHGKLTGVLEARKEKRMEERRSRMEKAQQIPKHALSEEQLKKLKSDQVGAESGERVSAVTAAIASKAARPVGHPGAQKPAGEVKDEEFAETS